MTSLRAPKESPNMVVHLAIYPVLSWPTYDPNGRCTSLARNQLSSRDLFTFSPRMSRGGGTVTIDVGGNCEPHVKMDYREFLIDRAGRLFAKQPPHATVLATNCSSKSMLSVTHHRCHEEPVNGAPGSLHADRATEFANSSADFLARLVVEGLEYNKLMLVVFETPAIFLQQQPVY